jgi:hypothetical protein
MKVNYRIDPTKPKRSVYITIKVAVDEVNDTLPDAIAAWLKKPHVDTVGKLRNALQLFRDLPMADTGDDDDDET